MKKIVMFLTVIFTSFLLISCATLQAEETTTLTTVEPTQTTEPQTTYTYYSLDNLIDQIYSEVYRQIYDEVYAEISSEIESGALDEEIYNRALAKLTEKIQSGEISVLVDSVQDEIDAVAAIASRSVVGVSNLDATPASMGSGVVYQYVASTDTYYLITNEHVVEGGTKFEIRFEDGSTVTPVLLGVDADVDVAILSFSGEGLEEPPVVSTFGNSTALAQGNLVLACGHPEGYDFYGSLTFGIISGLNRHIGSNNVDYIQIDAPINHGNSGGPLYNLQGQIIGINVLKLQSVDIEGMGFSIPIHQVIEVIQRVAPESL